MKTFRSSCISDFNKSHYFSGICLSAIFLLFHQSGIGQTISINSPQRLSEVISQRSLDVPFGDNRLEGLMWTTSAEMQVQQAQKFELLHQLDKLKTSNARFPNVLSGMVQLEKLIVQLPVTGRVLLPQQDPRWLEVHPSKNPILTYQDSLSIPSKSRWVTIIRDDGRICQLPFRNKVSAQHYTTLCDNKDDAVSSWAWVIQPDGSFQKVGLLSWNEGLQNSPEPGSWIWAPSSPKVFRQTIDALPWTTKRHFTEDFSNLLANFLATQGPSDAKKINDVIRADRTIVDSPLMLLQSQSYQPTEIFPVASDWGSIGLIQTPTARMLPAGSALINYTHVTPYTNYNFLLQPFDGLETTFRYTTVGNIAYGSSDFSGNQSYLDKSIDFKLRLLEENATLPQLAVGIRDVTGTGLFSGEYLVANKRYNNFDFSLGLAWGYMGNRGNLKNPISLLSSGFSTRPTPDVGQGGNFSFGTYFHGPTALIGGIQYQSPIQGLQFKLELDGNNYQREPFGEAFTQRLPINFGAVYRWDNASLSVGLERGNTAMISVSFFDNLSKLSTPKISEPAKVPVSYQRLSPPQGKRNIDAWQVDQTVLASSVSSPTKYEVVSSQLSNSDSLYATNKSQGSNTTEHLFNINHTKDDIQSQSAWLLKSIETIDDRWIVTLDQVDGVYMNDRINRVIRVLHRDAPSSVTTFEIRYQNRDLNLIKQVVNRQAWMLNEQQYLPPSYLLMSSPQVQEYSGLEIPNFATNSVQSSSEASALSGASDNFISTEPKSPWSGSTGIGYQQNLGGPNGYLFAISGVASVDVHLWDGAWVKSALSLRLLDNYDNYTYDAPSNLPRVRTSIREYQTTARLTLPTMQATQVFKLGDSHYFSAYAGMLEMMFGGIGGEWLYRPLNSSVALGLDINQVRQRDFDQRFTFLDYQVLTGHLTAYWQTGWQDVLVKSSIGQYLAGDRGMTLDVSRAFANGVRMGAYATKTNVSAADFGEGSFDKGIYVSIPFDAFFSKHTAETANLLWSPLIRDGGAKLNRQYPLYDLTKMRDSQSLQFGPPK